jgi:hypothetical protein
VVAVSGARPENHVLLSGDLQGDLLFRLLPKAFPPLNAVASCSHSAQAFPRGAANPIQDRGNSPSPGRVGSLTMPPRFTDPVTQARLCYPLGLYKVTHHCSRTGDCDDLLDSIKPVYAATSCARENRYDHPHTPPRDRIDRLTKDCGGRHALTFEDGDLSYSLDGSCGLTALGK